jgi:hypothetical protein
VGHVVGTLIFGQQLTEESCVIPDSVLTEEGFVEANDTLIVRKIGQGSSVTSKPLLSIKGYLAPN